MKYAWIKQHTPEFTVLSMCRFLEVSQSAYYAWIHRVPSSREREDAQLSGMVQTTFEKSRHTYGTRRLKMALSHQGQAVGRRRIRRLMKEAGLVCKTKRRFKVTTDSNHDLPIASNHLKRQFAVDQQTGSMWVTLPISLLKKVGCIWRWSSTCFPVRSLAGQWPSI